MSNRFYKVGTVVGIGIIAMIIALVAIAKNRDKKIAQENQSMIMSSTNLIEDEKNSTEVKKNEFKSIENEVKKNDNTTKNDSKKSTNNVTSKKTKEEDTKKVNAEAKNNKEESKELVFKNPVKGEIVQDFAKDKLVYSATLGEWVTHTGIDIRANKTTVVTASADGKVKSIKNDPRYGLTVVIEHGNDFSTVYANLLTAEFVKVGENVKAGQTIGTVGNTAAFEILDEPHLHFEILKSNEPIDPNMYLKN